MLELAKTVRETPALPDYPLQESKGLHLYPGRPRGGTPLAARDLQASPEPPRPPVLAAPELPWVSRACSLPDSEQAVQAPLDWLLLAMPRQSTSHGEYEIEIAPELGVPPAPVVPSPEFWVTAQTTAALLQPPLDPGVTQRLPAAIQAFPPEPPAAPVPDPAVVPAAIAPPPPAQPVQQVPQEPPRRKIPSWATTVVIATALSVIGGVFVHRHNGVARSSDQAAAAAPQQAPAPAIPANATPAAFSRYVEVAGLRIIAGGSKPQVHYIVVNHSGSPLPGMVLRLTVWSSSAAAVGQPVFTLSSSVPSLAPYASAELHAEVDLHGQSIPDWDSLRPEAQITAQ